MPLNHCEKIVSACSDASQIASSRNLVNGQSSLDKHRRLDGSNTLPSPATEISQADKLLIDTSVNSHEITELSRNPKDLLREAVIWQHTVESNDQEVMVTPDRGSMLGHISSAIWHIFTPQCIDIGVDDNGSDISKSQG